MIGVSPKLILTLSGLARIALKVAKPLVQKVAKPLVFRLLAVREIGFIPTTRPCATVVADEEPGAAVLAPRDQVQKFSK